MNTKKLAEWNDRLNHSHRVWDAKGLTGENGGQQLIRALEMYRGNPNAHWAGQWGDTGDERVIANIMFDLVNTADAQWNARAPRVSTFPTARDSAASARVAEAAINYYIGELKLKRQGRMAFLNALAAPFGIITHGYTPPEERVSRAGKRIDSFGYNAPNAPWMRSEAIWNVRIDTTGHSLYPEEARWFARRSLMRKSEIGDNPEMILPNDLSATRSMDLENMRPSELRSGENEDWNSFVEVWTVYDRIDEMWFSISPGSDKLLRKEQDWPIPWDSLPYDILQFNPQVDDPFAEPYMWQLMPIQEERNKLRTMMSHLARSLRRNVFVNDQALAAGEANRLFDGMGPGVHEFFKTNGVDPRLVVAEIQTGGFPQELLQYDAVLIEDARARVGLSNMDRAQRINVESATEANFVQQGSDTTGGRNQDAVEEFYQSVLRHFTQGLRTVADEEVIIPILGPEDAATLLQVQDGGDPFLRASPEAIQSEYGMRIVVGSTLPLSDSERQRKAIAWVELGKQFPEQVNMLEALRAVAESFDLDPQKVLVSSEQIAKQREVTQQQNSPEIADGGGENAGLRALAGGN